MQTFHETCPPTPQFLGEGTRYLGHTDNAVSSAGVRPGNQDPCFTDPAGDGGGGHTLPLEYICASSRPFPSATSNCHSSSKDSHSQHNRM